MSPRRLAVPAVVGVAVVAASLVPLGSAAGSAAPVGADKLLHAVGYAAIAATTCRAVRARSARMLAFVAVGAVALGAGVELLQGVVPTRQPSLGDAVANAVGALVGVAAAVAARAA